MGVKKQETEAALRTAAHQLITGPTIALLGAVVYLNALKNPFVYDDHRLILDNTSLQHLGDWRPILYHDISRPLVNLSYAIDYLIWGGTNAFGFHLTNLAIHVVNVLLVYGLASGLAEDHKTSRHEPERHGTIAAAAALLFAVHPALTQGVGFVSARAETLCAMFLMVAFISARRAIREGPNWWWILSTASWFLALACKEIAAMFPLILFAYDYLVAPVDVSQRRRRLWRVYVPLMALAMVLGVIRLSVLMTVEHSKSAIQWRFALVELDVFRRYVQLLLWPVGQTIFHAIDPIDRVTNVRAIGGFATVLLFAATIWKLRRQDVISFGLAWFVLLLIPSAVLVVLDRGEPMAEGRLYTASIGFFVAAGGVAAAILEHANRLSPVAKRRARDIGYAVIVVLALRTMTRNIVWHSATSLWLEAAESAPNHWLPRVALGEALHDDGKHEEAIGMFRSAIAMNPSDPLAYAKLGQCLLELGKMEDADVAFKSLRAVDPGSTAASTGLGLIALRARDSGVAREYFLQSLAKEPMSVPMRQVLASIAEKTDPAEALRWCEEIKRIAPQTPGNEECIQRNRARVDAAVREQH
jgi:tetratricopeptide (TPR) repeat protein